MHKKIAFLLIFMLLAVTVPTVPAFAEGTEPDAQQAEIAEGSTDEPEPQFDTDYYARFKDQGISINVYNWGEYISDGSDDTLDVNKMFTDLTGIKVYYSTYATNEELYSKLRGGGAKYDVIIPSDYAIGRMINESMLEPLNFDNIPNYAYIDAGFHSPGYDPDNRYSVPYTWGVVGIIYNKDMIFDDEVTSWDILWDERYMGNILMFSNPRDAFAIAQSKLGYSLNTTDARELEECLSVLKDQKPLVQSYVMDEIFDKMLNGEAALAPYYAGDAVTMINGNPRLDFAVPVEGTNIFVDAACIPKGSAQVEAAEMYINFLCEPEISAANGEYIEYALPSQAAVALLDAEVSANPVAYPPPEVIENAEYFLALPNDTNLLMDQLWTELMSTDDTYNKLVIPAFLLIAIVASIIINIMRHRRKAQSKNYF